MRYRSVGTVVFRSPSFPAALRDGSPGELSGKLRNLYELGLAIASPSLASAYSADEESLSPRHRYLGRASSRATPFGAWSAVFLGEWAPKSEVTLARQPRLSPSVDCGWYGNVLKALQGDSLTRRRLRWTLHTAAFQMADRLILSDAPSDDGFRRVSLKLTPVVLRVIDRARRPTEGAILVAIASEILGDVGRAQALVDMLCDLGVLVSELTPSASSATTKQLILHMASCAPPEVGASLRAVSEGLEAMGGMQEIPSVDSWQKLVSEALKVAGANCPLRTDLIAEPVRAWVDETIARELEELAYWLVCTSRFVDGLPYITAYAREVADRYGQGRPVPVLELLDPKAGLGPPASYPGSRLTEPAMADWPSRRLVLHRLLADALCHGAGTVRLDDVTMARLVNPAWDDTKAPVAVDLAAKVLFRPHGDSNDYLIVLTEDPGISAGAQYVGRFANALGPKAENIIHRVVDAELVRRPGVHAELSYLPGDIRLLNVATRPICYPYEISVGVWPALPPSRQVPLQDLCVVSDGRSLRLFRMRSGEDVYVHETHRLNHNQAPNIVRFLSDVTTSQTALPEVLKWEGAEDYPYRPRLQWHRTVLSAARWLVSTDADGLHSAADLERWLERWEVPPRVEIRSRSGQIGLDLGRPAHLSYLWKQLERQGRVEMLEDLSDPTYAWVTGPYGKHHAEIVATLLLEPRPDHHSVKISKPVVIPSRRDETRVPGSDWLYIRVNMLPDSEDSFLTGPLATLANHLEMARAVSSWHFLRLSEPEPTLRVRFHGEAERLRDEVWPQISRLTAELVHKGSIWNVAWETYHREISRYGGEAILQIAERVWGWDTQGILAVLACPERRSVPEVVLGALLQDVLLRVVGIDAAHRLEIYDQASISRHLGGDWYRIWGRQLLGLDATANGVKTPVERLRDAYLNAICAAVSRTPVPTSGDEVEAVSSQTWLQVAAQMVHLQAHRLGRPSWDDEAAAMALARRVLIGRAASKSVLDGDARRKL
jgi:thiopeptide-type bacteriocin biosynthesis protein